MGALGYLYRKTIVNRIKVALRKPVTYVYAVFILIYVIAVPFSFKVLLDEFGGANPGGMAAVLTLFGFWMLPANLISYVKRKGLVYRNSDVHFLFPSPIGPKSILLYAHIRTLILQLFLNIFVAGIAAILFHVDVWRVLIYFFFALVIENFLEAGIMMVAYGSEKLNEKQRKVLVWLAYALMLAFVLIGLAAYLQNGLSLESVMGFLHSDAVQLVPLTGWYIAVVHLIIMGPTTVNIIGTLLYAVFTVVIVMAAWKMKCTGEYYEDAIQFADDYEVLIANRKAGDSEARLGKKQKFGKAQIKWQGTGAKALFYRQLLEFKKSKFFIFDIMTVISLLAGVGISWLYVREGGFGEDLAEFGDYVLPVVAGYLIFIFSTMAGKWAKELKSPYTYMIPDSPFKKLWYATVMQNIQYLINGCLLVIPVAVVSKMSPLLTVLTILFYVILSSNKLYALAVAEIVTGNVLGTTGKQLLQLFIQGMAIGMAVMGGIFGNMWGGVITSYILMDLFLILYTGIFMVIAALNFNRLES